MMKMMTTTELATDFDTTPRELRKFLRSPESGIESVGKGSRYALPTAKRELAAMRKRFDAWTEAKSTKSIDEVEVPTDA
jgi:hypothetical protein